MAVTEQSPRAARTLDELYRRHAAQIYRYAYAVLGNHADAEDITQATFVNALRALERGEVPRKPSNWLVTIAHNLMRQRFRQAQARPVEVVLDREPAAALVDEDADDPSVEELVQALGRIPPTQREALVMREFEGRSYAEIAEILGVTTTALETLLFRARRSLAEEIENVVTCARAEQDLSRLLDGRLSRKERRRLREHVRSCPHCSRFEILQRRQRRALEGLALLPLPASLTLLKSHTAAAATAGLPTIGGAAAGASLSGGAAAGAGAGGVLGGLALGGVATKAAAVVAAVAVAGGAGYEGVQQLQGSKPARSKAPPSAQAARGATAPGRAQARTRLSAHAPAHARGATAPGRARSATVQRARGSERASTRPARSQATRGASTAAAARGRSPRRTSPTAATAARDTGSTRAAAAKNVELATKTHSKRRSKTHGKHAKARAPVVAGAAAPATDADGMAPAAQPADRQSSQPTDQPAGADATGAPSRGASASH